MSEYIIDGTCGNCGGPVVRHKFWMGVQPQIPKCRDCGARVRKPYGPTLPMEPPPPKNETKAAGIPIETLRKFGFNMIDK